VPLNFFEAKIDPDSVAERWWMRGQFLDINPSLHIIQSYGSPGFVRPPQKQ